MCEELLMLLITLNVTHKHTHFQYDSSGLVINPKQRPLPDNTQEINNHARGGIRNYNLSM
jgi:hypothetical protein